jgi:flagellar biosynthetic protein FliO
MRKGGISAALVLWLIVGSPTDGALGQEKEVSASESGVPASTGQGLRLAAYQEPQSQLPGAGVTSQIFTALGTVLGLLALGVYLHRKVTLRGSRGGQHGGSIQILSRTYLGPKESLCLVQVGAQVLLLGQTSSRITLLHAMEEPLSSPISGGGAGEAGGTRCGEAEGRHSPAHLHGFQTVLAGLESRLKRLNKAWGTEA